jgi:hypothetical protein
VLAAVDSTEVTRENQDGSTVTPQATELDAASLLVEDSHLGQIVSARLHAAIVSGWMGGVRCGYVSR